MRKKQVLHSCMLMMMSVSMAHAQTAFVSIQQNGISLESTLGTASFDISSQDATLEFDASGNVVMACNDRTVAKLTSDEVSNGGELVVALTGTETKVSKTISTDFATLYSPFQLQVPDGATVAVYAPTLDGNTLKVTSDRKLKGVIPPCTGLILYGGAGSSVTFNYSTEAPTMVENNALSGTSVAIANPTKNSDVDGKLVYTLAHESGTAGFYKYTGATLGAGKSYLYINQVASEAKSIVFSFNNDSQTAITSCQEESQSANSSRKFVENGSIVILKNGKKYNLNGQAIN